MSPLLWVFVCDTVPGIFATVSATNTCPADFAQGVAYVGAQMKIEQDCVIARDDPREALSITEEYIGQVHARFMALPASLPRA
jgi:hypothetical protein